MKIRHGARLCIGLVLFACALQASAQALVISEFRVRGPSGANDEYIEIFNAGAAEHTVAAAVGTGYAIVASDGNARAVIPNGTVIPAKGHYLAVNSMAYSLAAYPAGNGTTATGDATYTTDIPDNAGIALFNTSDSKGFFLANRLDAVGSTSEANTLYKEGTGYPALSALSIDYAFYRDACGKQGSITTLGPCPSNGVIADTGNNAVDFIFVDTNGTSAGAGQRLGAPGPQNLSSPLADVSGISNAQLDSCVNDYAAPNVVREFTSDPAQNSTFGTFDFRHTFTNATGSSLTRLRFRIVDITTFPAPSGFADFRPRTSTPIVVTVDRPPCGSVTSNVTVEGTTLEQPPSQPNGSGFNGSMSVGAVSLATPLPNGGSIDLRFLMGIQQTGQFKFGIVPEGLPNGSSAPVYFECFTDGACGIIPSVVSIVRVNPSPTSASSVDYTVTFDQAVTGVDAADFALTSTGTIAGASITNVTGSGTTWTVTVATGTGSGTLRLDVIDNDTIVFGTTPLGGAGAGNGNFTTGQVYDINRVAPNVVSSVRANPNPTGAASVDYTVTFDQAVTGVDATDFALTTTGTIAGASITGVAGSGTTWTVTVATGTGAGTIRLDVIDNDSIIANGTPLGGAGAGNGNFTTGEAYDVDRSAPTVSVSQAPGQTDPSPTSPINFTVTFSEPVTGFDAADVIVGGTAGATTVVVSGGPTVYTVAVSGMTGPGTVTISIVGGAAIDGSGNPSAASTAVDNTVVFTPAATGGTTESIPALSPTMLIALAMLLGLLAYTQRGLLRR